MRKWGWLGAVVGIVAVYVVASWLVTKPPSGETVTELAYRVCRDQCGMYQDEVDSLIESQHGVPADASLRLSMETFENGQEAKPCLPCAEAIIAASR